jgi:hypothetical protein
MAVGVIFLDVCPATEDEATYSSLKTDSSGLTTSSASSKFHLGLVPRTDRKF